MDVVRSVLGMVVLLTAAFLLSTNKKKTNLRTIGAALTSRAVVSGIMLWLPPGRWVTEKVAFGVYEMMAYNDAGSAFIFGSLIESKMDTLFDGAGLIFGFRVLPAIIFVTALVNILYYIDVTGILIRILDGISQGASNINRIELFVAVTTISLGQNEILAIIRPFINRLNRNESFIAICSGMVLIAGSAMIGYVVLGVPMEHPLAASLMAIPGRILFTRLLSPVMESSQIPFNDLSFTGTPPKSIIEAITTGVMTRLKVTVGVATVITAFVTIIVLVNGIVSGVGGWFGPVHASLESVLGYLLAPLAWVMGVSWSDANLAGGLTKQKLAVNEFVAYLNLSLYLQTGGTLGAKTVAIISFALYGFVDSGPIGVVVGAFPVVTSHHVPEITQLGLRALAVATLSNLMSAIVAGFFIDLV